MNQLETNFPKIRISRHARVALEKLVRLERKARGSNVSMGDIASELIVSALRSRSNGKAHIVGQSQPTVMPTGEVSGVLVGQSTVEVK